MNNTNNRLVTFDETPAVINPMDAPVNVFKSGLDRRKTNRNALLDWIRSSLVEGRDYGSIMIKGRMSKPSLLKPGAEKIAGMLGLIPIFPNLNQYEDAALSGKTINAIIIKCELTNQDGTIIGQGVGARFVEKQDKGDLNKSMKMAVKSAMIDATLRCAGLSEIFTQDVEEMRDVSCEEASVDLASEKQIAAIEQILGDYRVTEDERRRVSSLIEDEISKEKAGEILDYFLGKSKFIDGEWRKTTCGEFENRGSGVSG
mgnify:FL=1